MVMASDSTSLRVFGPKSMSKCMDMLSMFGDIARLDVSQADSSGQIAVTFFDIRCAQCALEQLGETMAESIPSQEQDFRALATLQGFSGRTDFSCFGEVADMRSMPNGSLAVEFYDMRAAQRALIAVQGSHPVSVKELRTGMAMEASPTMIQTPPGLDVQQWQESALNENVFSSDGSSSQDEEKVGQVAKVQITEGNSPSSKTGGATSKPVAPDEFASLELNLDKIAAGQDTRTTVMLRRISKSKTQADLVTMLGQCGLAGRYTFLYMPYDKRRNSHCRFAFVDFLSPQDVLQLETSLQMFRKLSRAGCGLGVDEQLAVVSYARLQGRKQLLQHFGTAAVMHDKDVSRRPQFLNDCAQHMHQSMHQLYPLGDESPSMIKKQTLSPKAGKSLDEPIYVPLPVGALPAGMMVGA